MAARDDSKSHLQANCLYTGISSGPNAWYERILLFPIDAVVNRVKDKTDMFGTCCQLIPSSVADHQALDTVHCTDHLHASTNRQHQILTTNFIQMNELMRNHYCTSVKTTYRYLTDYSSFSFAKFDVARVIFGDFQHQKFHQTQKYLNFLRFRRLGRSI